MDEFQVLLQKFDRQPETQFMAPKGKVLVIDDDPNIRQGLERTLTHRNYEVCITTNGKDGLDRINEDIHVVLLDVKLPRVDGTQVYTLLKEKCPNIPIIFYSAYPGNDDVADKCRDLGPYAFIEKGVYEEIDRLYDLIDKAVSKRVS